MAKEYSKGWTRCPGVMKDGTVKPNYIDIYASKRWHENPTCPVKKDEATDAFWACKSKLAMTEGALHQRPGYGGAAIAAVLGAGLGVLITWIAK